MKLLQKKFFIILFFACFSCVSCSSNKTLVSAPQESAKFERSGDLAQSSSSSSPSVQPEIKRKIIKNANLKLFVQDINLVMKQIQDITKKTNGFVSESEMNELEKDLNQANIILRIPENNFESILKEIENLAIKVQEEKISANDITEEFIDLESQLRNLKAQENQYLELLKKAKNINEILQVSEKIGEKRSQIEVLEGRLKYLNHQSAMSTISIQLNSEKNINLIGISWNFKKSFTELMRGIILYLNFIISFTISTLPLIVIWLITSVIIGFGLYKLFCILWKKLNQKK